MAAVLDNLLAARAAAPLVSIAALRRRHGSEDVLKGVDLDLRRGEVVALIGASGAGKSTLLRCVKGLEAFQGGAVSVQGRPPSPPGARRQPVALVFQGHDLPPQLGIGEHLMRSPALADRPGAAGQALELLARVGLAGCFEALPAELSAAQQQRAVIARALAGGPSVLLCDDITTPDDPEQAIEVGLVLQALADAGLAVLVATHDAALVRAAADRVVFLHDGRVHESGTPAALLEAPQTPELRRFMKRFATVTAARRSSPRALWPAAPAR